MRGAMPSLRQATRHRLVGAAFTVIALHLVVVALLTEGDVAPFAALGWLGAAPVLLLAFDRGGRLARMTISGSAGLIATAAGVVTHIGRIAFNGPSATDITGAALAVAGGALLVVAARQLFRGTRRATKLLGLPLALVFLQFYVFPVLVTGTVATNAPRGDSRSAATLGIAGAQGVRFTASDGVELGGWFVPGRTRATVIVLHGSHGTRSSTTGYLRMLHRAGYTTLAYDARGHGASGGHENALGWNGARDLAGAVAYLRTRAEVDPRRIAALGLSMGGEEALRAAGQDVPLAAVVADGAGSSTLGDSRLENGTSALYTAVTWTGMRAVEIFARDDEPRPLADVVRAIRSPVLLISSRRRGERRIDAIFRERIGAAAALWYVADADHTQAFGVHPRAYRQHVLAFLADALR